MLRRILFRIQKLFAKTKNEECVRCKTMHERENCKNHQILDDCANMLTSTIWNQFGHKSYCHNNITGTSEKRTWFDFCQIGVWLLIWAIILCLVKRQNNFYCLQHQLYDCVWMIFNILIKVICFKQPWKSVLIFMKTETDKLNS